MNDIIFFLAAAGATIIVQSGRIFQPLRNRLSARVRRFVECELCFGWWVGAVLACAWHLAGHQVPVGFTPVGVFSIASANSIITYAIGRIIGDDGLRLSNVEKTPEWKQEHAASWTEPCTYTGPRHKPERPALTMDKVIESKGLNLPTSFEVTSDLPVDLVEHDKFSVRWSAMRSLLMHSQYRVYEDLNMMNTHNKRHAVCIKS